MKRSYRRHLPHQIPEDTPIFVTFCLKGALPKRVRTYLRQERERLELQPRQKGESTPERKNRVDKILFGIMDRALDSNPAGVLHLKNEQCASLVENVMLFGAGSRYDLLAWCVMANHVHALLKPGRDFSRLMQGIKGYSAYRVNQLLRTQGQAFWLDESYDHWPRDEDELFRIIQYIEFNPVAAGLCQSPSDWRWSSASRRTDWPLGTPYVPKVRQPFLADSSVALELFDGFSAPKSTFERF